MGCAVEYGGYPIASYVIETYDASTGQQDLSIPPVVATGTSTSATVSNLTASTWYYFWVFDYNAVGSSNQAQSNYIETVYPPIPPAPVQNPAAVATGAGTIQISWSPPSYTGSASPISSYFVNSQDDTTGVYGGIYGSTCGTCTSITLSGFIPYHFYSFFIFDFTAAGYNEVGPPTPMQMIYPTISPAPVVNSAAEAVGSGAITVTWSAPLYNTGSGTITSYFINSQDNTTGVYGGIYGSACASCTSITLYGFTANHSYSFFVFDFTQAGYNQGGPPTPMTMIYPRVSPSWTQNVAAQPTGTSSALVTWSPPATIGSATMDHYTVVTYDTATGQGDPNVPGVSVCATCTAAPVSGLVENTSYFFVVFDWDSAGGYSDGVSGSITTYNDPIPFQLLAKGFTEMLGRKPNSGDWGTWTSWWSSHYGNACGPSQISGFESTFLGAAYTEFSGDYGSNLDAATIATVRLVLNRDPDPGSYPSWRSYLSTHGYPSAAALQSLASYLAGTTEFQTLASGICNPGLTGYSFGKYNGGSSFTPTPPLDPTNAAGGYSVPDQTATLQSIAQHPNGSHQALLQQGHVYGVCSPIDVPAGVQLITSGAPGPHSYLNMARIVKLPSGSCGNGGFPTNGDTPMVRLEGGGGASGTGSDGLVAQLDNAWVDGENGLPGVPAQSGVGGQDVEIRNCLDTSSDPTDGSLWPGCPNLNVTGVNEGGAVQNNRLDDAASKQVVTAWGGADGEPWATPYYTAGSDLSCGSAVISGNLVTGYTSVHLTTTGPSPQDGIQAWCDNTTVSNNSIVDETDAPIVMFAPNGDSLNTSQHSEIVNNYIQSAGNSSFYGIVADPGKGTGNPNYCFDGTSLGDEGALNATYLGYAHKNYAGASLSNNHLWTSPRTFFDIIVSVGTHALQGSCDDHSHNIAPAGGTTAGAGLNGEGLQGNLITFSGNTDDGQTNYTQVGIYAGGMYYAQVDNGSSTGFQHLVWQGAGHCLVGVNSGAGVPAAYVAAVGTPASGLANYVWGLSGLGGYTPDQGLQDDGCNLGV